MANDTTGHEPLREARLAEIRATLSDEEGMSDLVYRFTSEWASVRFKGDLAQVALDLLAEVERSRAREDEVMIFAEFVAAQRPGDLRDDSMLRRQMIAQAHALLGAKRVDTMCQEPGCSQPLREELYCSEHANSQR